MNLLSNISRLSAQYHNDPAIAEDSVTFQFDDLKAIGREGILDDPTIIIVDVGSFGGARVKVLRDMGFCNAMGVEQDPKRAADNPELVKIGMAHRLPFADGTVDLILMKDVFSDPNCPQSNQYQNMVMKEFARVLRKGGLVNIADSCTPGRPPLDNDARQLLEILEDNRKTGSFILEKK